MKLREEEFYEQYHQHGGTTIIPTEIFNELYDDATEEIERLKEEYMILQNASDEVEEEKDREIERLQDLCNKYEKEHKTTYEIWKKDIYLYNSLVDRIDKAIEYIENNFISYEDSRTFGGLGEEIDIQVKETRELLNILKGVDKE